MEHKKELNVYNKMGLKSKDECYTTYAEAKKIIDYLISQSVLTKDMKIWLPFDNGLSNLYKYLNHLRYKTILSNLEIGLDFYNYEPYEWYDIIITNPPFSKRTKLLKRMFSFKKPFVILQGTQFFNNQSAIKYLIEYQTQINFIFPKNRMNFLTYNETLDRITTSKNGISFYSFWITYKLGLYPKYIHLEDNQMEKDFEQYDLLGNQIIDKHLTIFNV